MKVAPQLIATVTRHARGLGLADRNSLHATIRLSQSAAIRPSAIGGRRRWLGGCAHFVLFVIFVLFAILLARPVAVLISFLRTGIPPAEQLFMAWFGPKGVASMLFALFVLKSDVANNALIFDTAAIAIIVSIVAHGLTDTIGAQWLAGRVGLTKKI